MGLDEWEGGWQKGILETVVLCTEDRIKPMVFLLYIYLWFLDVLNGLYFIRYTGVLFNQFYILL